MTFQVAQAPENRIRQTLYDVGDLTGTEPISDQEVGYWLRVNVRPSIASYRSLADFLAERVACPRSKAITARSSAAASECIRDAISEIRDHFESAFASEGRDAWDRLSAGDPESDVSPLIKHHPPEWSEVFSRLDRLSGLRDGWNSYAAPRPAQDAISNAREFLNVLLAARLMPTRVRPSAIGGVGITFRRGIRKVYVEFLNNGHAHVLFSDGVGDPDVREIGESYQDYLTLISETRNYLND